MIILAGLLGVIFTIVGQAITLDAPTIDEGGGKMAEWLADNRAMALSATYLLGLGLSLLIPLTIAIFGRLRAAEGEHTLMSGVFLTAGLAALAIAILATGTFMTAAYRADSISAGTAELLTDMTYAALTISAFPTAISLLAGARVILQTRALPAYVGYIAVLGGLIHLASAAAFDTGSGWNLQNGGALSAIAYYLFAITAGVALLRQAEEPSAMGLATSAAMREMAGGGGGARPEQGGTGQTAHQGR